MQNLVVDRNLLARFEAEIRTRVPRVEGEGKGRVVLNPTPLVDISEAVLECARSEYGLNLSADGVRVFGKFDSRIPGGSVKVRPAVRIIGAAIEVGKLTSGQTVFEATSGNFGLAMGALGRLGLNVVLLVSRKLQEGVVRELEADGLKLINLDIDVCPAPGVQAGVSSLMGKAVAESVRGQLIEIGFDPAPFDGVRAMAEELLSNEDAINLAKLLAGAYGGFCPEQYDSELNVLSHYAVTGPELEYQLGRAGAEAGEFEFICAFGTGGTATGLSRYFGERLGRRTVRAVFPLEGQEVAGIRTKRKAAGLKFYQPTAYAGEHELDFQQARRTFSYFNREGFDVGESGALALYACMQLINFGTGKKFVVMIADGASKYQEGIEGGTRKARKDEVTLQEASSGIGDYAAVVWTHTTFVPREEGIRVIASSLGCPTEAVKVATTREVQNLMTGGEPSEELRKVMFGGGRRVLLVCMAGNTSLLLARRLVKVGIEAESLTGGITALPAARAKQPFELVQVARG